MLVDMKIFALKGTMAFGRAFTANLRVALAEHEERDYEGGEHKARPLVSLRGNDVFIIHTLNGSPEGSVNDKLCKLLFFCGHVPRTRRIACNRRRPLSRQLAQGSANQVTRPGDDTLRSTTIRGGGRRRGRDFGRPQPGGISERLPLRNGSFGRSESL